MIPNLCKTALALICLITSVTVNAGIVTSKGKLYQSDFESNYTFPMTNSILYVINADTGKLINQINSPLFYSVSQSNWKGRWIYFVSENNSEIRPRSSFRSISAIDTKTQRIVNYDLAQFHFPLDATPVIDAVMASPDGSVVTSTYRSDKSLEPKSWDSGLMVFTQAENGLSQPKMIQLNEPSENLELDKVVLSRDGSMAYVLASKYASPVSFYLYAVDLKHNSIIAKHKLRENQDSPLVRYSSKDMVLMPDNSMLYVAISNLRERYGVHNEIMAIPTMQFQPSSVTPISGPGMNAEITGKVKSNALIASKPLLLDQASLDVAMQGFLVSPDGTKLYFIDRGYDPSDCYPHETSCVAKNLIATVTVINAKTNSVIDQYKITLTTGENADRIWFLTSLYHLPTITLSEDGTKLYMETYHQSGSNVFDPEIQVIDLKNGTLMPDKMIKVHGDT